MSMYFAQLPSNEIVPELKERVRRYYKNLEETGRLSRLKKSYSYYYGESSTHSSTGIQRGGSQGELHLVKVNEYRNLIQHLLVLTTQSRPAYRCMAVNNDVKSQHQAILGNGLLEYYLKTKKVEQHLRSSTESALVLDEGFVHLEWDTELGQPLILDQDKYIREGDIRFSTLSPLDVIRDPYRRSPDQDWLIVRFDVNKYDLAAKYPDFKEDIERLQIDFAEHSFVDYSKAEETSMIYGYIFYHAKTAAMPDGRLVLFAGDKNLLDVPLPYGDIPVFRTSAADVLSSIFGYSPGADLLVLQEVTDALHSAITSNQLTFGTQSIIGPKGADLNVSHLANGMTYFELDPKMIDMLKPLQLTSTPAELFNYITTIRNSMQMLSGVNSVSRGDLDSIGKNTSGAAMALIQSMTLQFTSGLQASYAQLLENVGTGIIKMLQSFARSPRVAEIAGNSKRYMLKSFSSKDLAQISRVVVEATNPMSQTLSGRLEMAKDLLNSGLITRPQAYVTVLNTGRVDSLDQTLLDEELTIQAENEMLSQGKSVPVVMTDNHPEHIKGHKSVISNPESRQDPQVLMATLQHIQQHMDQLREAPPELLAILGMQPLPPAQPSPGASSLPQTLDNRPPDEKKAAQTATPKMPVNPLSGQEFDTQTGGLPS